jgi:hypothetical protein
MQIITPHYVLLHDKVSANLSVAFDEKIEKIAPLDELLEFAMPAYEQLLEYSL